MAKTRPIIIYDLSKSPYKHTEDGMTYIFSSEYHRDNFISRLPEMREYVEGIMLRKFKMRCKFNQLADMRLYLKIETRGFRVECGGHTHICPETIVLSGANGTYQN